MDHTPGRRTPTRHHVEALERRTAYLRDRIRTPHHDNRFRKGRKYELAELNALEWVLKQLHVSDEQDVPQRAPTAPFLDQTTYEGTPSEPPTGNVWFPGDSDHHPRRGGRP